MGLLPASNRCSRRWNNMRPTEAETTSRSGGKRKIKKKLIIVSEGYRTEQNYFIAIKDEWGGLKFNTIMELRILNRFSVDAGKSDPSALANIVKEYIAFIETGIYSVNLFAGRFIESMMDSEAIRGGEISQVRSEIESLLSEKGLISCDTITDVKIAEDECLRHFRTQNVTDFALADYSMEYYKGDVICLVVDRDKEARSSQAYSEFLRKCREEKFRPFVTNPKFELWALFHFDETEKLISDLKDKTKCITVLEREIRKRHINKDYDFHTLVYHINTAMDISKAFRNDPENLKNEVGTNLPDLIDLMRTGGR